MFVSSAVTRDQMNTSVYPQGAKHCGMREKRELNWNRILIELKLNFHWIEIEVLLNWNWISLNWNWIAIELKLKLDLEYCYIWLAILCLCTTHLCQSVASSKVLLVTRKRHSVRPRGIRWRYSCPVSEQAWILSRTRGLFCPWLWSSQPGLDIANRAHETFNGGWRQGHACCLPQRSSRFSRRIYFYILTLLCFRLFNFF